MEMNERIQELLIEAIGRYDRGDLAAATHYCSDVLALDAEDSAALHLLGLIANDQGDPARATGWLQQAVRCGPEDADAWNDYGNALQRCGRLHEALEAFGSAKRLAPRFADPHSNFGYMLFRLGRLEESLPHFRSALAIEADFTLAYNNLGSALLELGRHAEAIEAFRSAIECDPICADGYVNLGNALRRCDCHAQAFEVLQQGRQRAHPNPQLLLNLGGVHKDLGQFDDAICAYEEAIVANSAYAEAHWNLSLVLLARSQLARGWEEFEWRRKILGLAPDALPQNSTEWKGESVAEKTLLVIAEQGLGDTLQFIRYATMLKQNGARVIAAVQPPLMKILAGCDGIDEIVPLDAPFPPHDLFCLTMSLPRLMSPVLELIPKNVPYLHADPLLIAQWRDRLAQIPGFKIGISWQGNPTYGADRYRSIPLDQFEVLAQVPGVTLISLQRGYGSEQLAAARTRLSIVEFPGEVDATNGPFMDTAAIVKNLDLVISSDTAIVHLAGGLGVPVWMATSFVPDWRWLLDRSDSPWYPTLRLFRQHERLNWRPVFEEMATALGGFVP